MLNKLYKWMVLVIAKLSSFRLPTLVRTTLKISAIDCSRCISDKTIECDGDDVKASQKAQAEYCPPSYDLLDRCDSPFGDAGQTPSSDATR